MELRNPRTGYRINVPESATADYVAAGWVRPGADPTPAPLEEQPDPIELTELTIPQLTVLAADWKIPLGDARTKADIVALIEAGLTP